MPRSQPNYLTAQADGKIGAEFSGKIRAQGVILPAALAVNNAPAASAVQWERQSDGAILAQIVGTESGETSVIGRRVTNGRGAGLFTQNDNTGHFVEVRGEVAAGAVRAVVENALGDLRVIMDQAGSSSFVQLAGGGNRRLNWGYQIVNTPAHGSNTDFGTSAIAHGLGSTPAFVTFMTAIGGALVGSFIPVWVQAVDTVQFQPVLRNNNAGPIGAASMALFWMAGS